MHLKRIISLLSFLGAISISAQNNAPAGADAPTLGVKTNKVALTATNFVASGVMVTNGVLVSSTSNNVPPTSILGTNFVVQPITMADVVQMALQNNYDVQIARSNPDIARFNLEGSYSAWEPAFTASGVHQYSKSPPGGFQVINGTVFQSGGSETEGETFTAGIGGLAPTGLQYGINGRASRSVAVTFPPNTANPFDTHANWTLDLTQPILRNFWMDGPRRDILINKKRLKISEWQLRRQLITTIANVEAAYYDLIQSRENIKVQRAALEYANQLLRENKKRVEVGALAPLDEKQAEAEVARAVANLLVTEQSYAVSLNSMKNLVTQDFANWMNVVLDPVETLVAIPAQPELAESWKRGLTLRPELQEARLNIEAQDITIKFLKNQVWPQLDIVGSYGLAGVERTYSSAIEEATKDNSPSYTYGAQLSIPIGNRSARYNLKAARVSSKQLLLDYKQLEQTIMVGIDNAIKLLQSRFQQVEASRQARLFAQDALAAEQKKYENGKSTSFLVLQAQRDLTSRRFEEIQALADYNRALSGLAAAEGATLERNSLNFTIE
jgi:outer membrane protein